MQNQGFKIGKKILVADDEPHIMMTLEDLLTQEGYVVLKASDGKKAFDEARKMVPDLIVLDVMMPKMNGFEVLQKLKKEPKTMDIPVIMLTVRSAAPDVQQGIQLYAEKYVTKPFEPELLLKEIEHSLAIRYKMPGQTGL
ncbi:MAG TPA: response regulator [Candidatus Omnitrophota bacterium]|nr:response regulator [Candidatus Omnitrophota bacterium]